MVAINNAYSQNKNNSKNYNRSTQEDVFLSSSSHLGKCPTRVEKKKIEKSLIEKKKQNKTKNVLERKPKLNDPQKTKQRKQYTNPKAVNQK